MNFKAGLIRRLLWLTAFSIVLLVSAYVYLQQEFSAVFIVLVLTTLLIATKLLSIYHQSEKQLETVFKALANNDPTLGISDASPLAKKIAQVREQIQTSRLEAEVQAQFLQSLLLHLDQAVIVVDDNDNIIQKNPASEKLLGKLVTDVHQLGALGKLITTTSTNHRETISWQQGEHKDTFSVHISCCQIQGKLLKLVSIQSIYHALIAKEQQAYKQLTKVLTHEVANSITPLASLAQTAHSLIPSELTFEELQDKDDLDEALTTLASRTSQLSAFIKSFNQITALPKPNLATIEPAKLVEQVLTLFKSKAESQQTTLTFNDQAHCLLVGDAAQLEQTIINILKNALEAVALCERREVRLCLHQKADQHGRQQVMLDIEDTGLGIAPHVVDQIFVPFFTTKAKGSGIGLSLSRQIMIQHGGELSYIDKPDCGGCFRLLFGVL